VDLEAKTVMGQMNIISGEWVSDVPNALAVREPIGAPGRSRRKGDLFVVVQMLAGDPRDLALQQMSQALATTIRNTYYQAPSSIAASLRRALLAANSLLLDTDSTSLMVGEQEVQGRVRAGVVVLAVRGREVFVATVGPLSAYLLSRGKLVRFPEASYRARNEADAAVFGEGPEVEIDISHASVADGDMMVLGDGRFSSIADRDAIAAALASGTVEDTLVMLGEMAQGQDCTAMVVQVRIPAVAGEPSAHTVEEPQVAIPARRLREVPASAHSPLDRVSVNVPDLPIGRALRGVGVHLVQFLVVVGKVLWSIFRAVLPGSPDEVPSEVERYDDRQPDSTGFSISQPLLRAAALILPLLMILLVLTVYWSQIADQQNAYAASLAQASVYYEEALRLDDPASAHVVLEQAEGLLAAAAEVNADDPILHDLRDKVRMERERVERVEELYWIGRVYTYAEEPILLRRVVVSGLDVFVLDIGEDVVYHHQLDETMDGLRPSEGDSVLLRRATQVGDTVVGEMIDMAWVGAVEGREASNLVILEGDGLLAYNPTMGVAALQVTGVETWLGPVAVAGYGGNYYILDPPAGQVHRYLSGPGGYSRDPELYFPSNLSAELMGAVDLAIDGFVYVLNADCSVRKYERGVEAGFELSGVPTPMTDCVALFTAPDDVTKSLYVADAGRGRILQFDKEGHFVRQLRPREEGLVDFTDLKSIYVNELSAKLVFVDSHSLYVANLPPRP
jgi:hypothetical protein